MPEETTPEETMPEENWYIVKAASEQCEIMTEPQMESLDSSPTEKWGPFKTQNQAIAKRVGLIRAGKCKPA